MEMYIESGIILLAAYLLGSIPFGLILTRMAGLGDIRKIGSGNIGATNVLRTGNKKLAALTLLLDGFKGWFAVWLLYIVAPLAAVGVITGHCFPVWLKFKGGKGVATTFGAAFGLHWQLGAAACLIWLLVAVLFRYSSLSALVAVAALPFVAWFLGMGVYTPLLACIAIFVWARHHENIKRLLAGTESKIGQKK